MNPPNIPPTPWFQPGWKYYPIETQKQTNHLSPIIMHIIPTLSKTISITNIINSTNQLEIDTIASGRKGKIKLIHNLDHQGPKLVALSSTREKATSQVESAKLIGTRAKENTSFEDIITKYIGKLVTKMMKKKCTTLQTPFSSPKNLQYT
jgi:hypothetical protein